ncbi:MAG: HEAT repeat domain-containing protein, partial [Candidatus Jordarchaeaceae archaeon]
MAYYDQNGPDVTLAKGEYDIRKLMESLKNKLWDIRQAAANALIKIGEPAVEPLIRALRDDDHTRITLIWVLGQIGDKRATEPLIETLKDDDWHIREAAAIALGNIKDERAVQPLIQTLKDEDDNVWVEAVTALEEIGEPAVEPLIQALKDQNKNLRWGAARALGKIRDRRAVQPLKNV